MRTNCQVVRLLPHRINYVHESVRFLTMKIGHDRVGISAFIVKTASVLTQTQTTTRATCTICSIIKMWYSVKHIEDITRWREDMNFMFEWQEQYLTSERSLLVRYCSCHENIKFISSSQRVVFFLLYGD